MLLKLKKFSKYLMAEKQDLSFLSCPSQEVWRLNPIPCQLLKYLPTFPPCFHPLCLGWKGPLYHRFRSTSSPRLRLSTSEQTVIFSSILKVLISLCDSSGCSQSLTAMGR